MVDHQNNLSPKNWVPALNGDDTTVLSRTISDSPSSSVLSQNSEDAGELSSFSLGYANQRRLNHQFSNGNRGLHRRINESLHKNSNTTR